MINDRDKWLKARLNGIGASEASCVLGLNPYKTNIELWEEKTGRKVAVDISDKNCVAYGNNAEQPLRELFKLDFPQYAVEYNEFKMIANMIEYPFIFATLDSELTHSYTKEHGVLEIKTTEIQRSEQWKKWDKKIPDNYYIQVLHQLLATGYDFAILKAQIKWQKDGEIQIATRHYTINRQDVLEDMDHLLQAEIIFWQCVKEDKRPNLILNI